jgi:superfamily II DNA helicase RecQ
VFVATDALGLGIDAPHIRVVIHMGVRSRITVSAQESGRVGRDGQKSEAIVLRGCWSKNNGERVKENGYKLISNDAINVFDQVRIENFLQRPSAVLDP